MKLNDADLAKEVIERFLDYAKAETMRRAYERIAPGEDGRIRTWLSPVGTVSGRFSSSETFMVESSNLQNMSKKVGFLDPLYRVRDLFIPSPGHVLLAADFGKAELYGYLAFAGDWEKIEKLEKGEDLHSAMAAEIYGKPIEKVTKKERFVGKTANFALGYGAGWSTFFEHVNSDVDITGIAIDASTAKRAVEAWRRLNDKTVRWWGSVEREAREKGYLENALGRRRIIIDKGNNAVNAWISWKPQSTIADHLNARMRIVYETLDPERLKIILQIHDEVLTETHVIGWLRTAKFFRDAMLSPIMINGREITLPVEVSASSESWGKMKELKL